MIKYTDGYKYQLYETYNHAVPATLPLGAPFKTDYCIFDGSTLTIFKEYAWDGPSGPTVDTKSFMRGSLVHDTLYELMRDCVIEKSMKDYCDKELVRICEEDGMCAFRAWYVYQGLKMFGKDATIEEKNIEVAP